VAARWPQNGAYCVPPLITVTFTPRTGSCPIERCRRAGQHRLRILLTATGLRSDLLRIAGFLLRLISLK